MSRPRDADEISKPTFKSGEDKEEPMLAGARLDAVGSVLD